MDHAILSFESIDLCHVVAPGDPAEFGGIVKKFGTISGLVVVAILSQGCGQNNSTSSGTTSRITQTIKCDFVVSGLSGGAGAALNGLQMATTIAVTGAGDVFATAEVIDDESQHSGSSIYATGEIGTANPTILINADYSGVANGGYFDISSDRNNAGVSVIYTDSSLGAESPVVMSFSNSNCTAVNW